MEQIDPQPCSRTDLRNECEVSHQVDKLEDCECEDIDVTLGASVAGASGTDLICQKNEENIDPNVRIKMLARVALSDAHFKHQQRGDPDLTMDEKIDIVQTVLDTSFATFLARFGNYIELEDIEYFKHHRHIYEVDFYCKQVEKTKTGNFQRNKVKNRRYEAMKELMSKGEYFSEDEMKYRDPYLYDQMVGQYLTDKEVQAKIDKSDLTFSSILLKHIDQMNENARYEHDKDVEEGQEEEEEEEEQEEDMEEEESKTCGTDREMEEEEEKIPEARRQELKAEFLTLMQERFLKGDDHQFDYSKVDNNDAYDNLTLLNNDAEEKYFDDDDYDDDFDDNDADEPICDT